MTKHWYHFTTREAARKIVREGLRPRGDQPANYHGKGLDSNPKYAYLTSRLCRPWHCFDYLGGAVVVIDADYLEPYLIRADEDEEKFGTLWTAAYEGVIDPAAIQDIIFFESVKNAAGQFDYARVPQEFWNW